MTSAPSVDLSAVYGQRLVWRGCGDAFECTTLRVPIDYKHPNGRSIGVRVNRLPASGRRIGALVINPGGPGVSGLDYARAARSVVTAAVRRRYDIVGFDPRGVAHSVGLQCLGDRAIDRFVAVDGTPDTAREERGLLHQGQVLGRGCAVDRPTLVAHVGTRDVARDLDVLRAALAERRLTYLGKSYGTYLGATYAGLFPKRVGKLVLDGPLDPANSTLDIARGQGVGFERALAAFLDDCGRRSSCPVAGDRDAATAQIARLFADIDRRPLPGDGERRLTESLAVLGVAVSLYDEDSWSFLRHALGAALDGNGSALLQLADVYTDRGPGGHFTTNANDAIYAVNCLDRPTEAGIDETRADAAEVSSVAPLFGPYIVWSGLPCSTWPVAAQGDPEPIAAAGSKPILVVGTTRDPATPYEWAQALADQLESGHLLTYVGDGHTAYRRGSSCIDRAVDSYLLHGTLPAAHKRCR